MTKKKKKSNFLVCANNHQKNLIRVIGWHLTGRRHIHIGREMSCCTCSLIKSTSWETARGRDREGKRERCENVLCMTDCYYTSAYNKSLQLKYLEAFIGYNQSAAGYHSRFLKQDICSAFLWFNAIAHTDGWELTQVVLPSLLLPPSGP